MEKMRFNKELYSRVALIKAAYNYTDRAYVHLDSDNNYYYVEIEAKREGQNVSEKEFMNELLAQSARHEVYKQTKEIRELLLARAMATSVITDEAFINGDIEENYSEDEILKDWFADNE